MGEARARAACTGRSELGPALGIVEQRAQCPRERGRLARRHVHPRQAVHDGIDLPADRGRHNGHAASHRLQRDDPERLVPRHADDGVGRSQQRGHSIAPNAPAQDEPVSDFQLSRQAAQAAHLGIVVELVGVGASGDVQLGVRERGERRDRVADALALDEPACDHEPMTTGPARFGRPGRREAADVDAARHDRDGAQLGLLAHQLEDLVRAGRDHAIHAARDLALDRYPLWRACVLGALMPPLDRAQGVKGVNDRDPEPASSFHRGQAGHPEVRVHDVRRVLDPLLAQAGGEVAHVGEQLVLGQLAGRARVDVVDLDAGRERHPAREQRIVAARVHHDRVAVASERRGQRRDMDVLAAGVDPTQHCERARVLGDHRDPHRVPASASSASHSPRKRCSP